MSEKKLLQFPPQTFHENHPWEEFQASFDVYCIAHDIPDAKKAIFLLQALESSTLVKVISWCKPKTIKDVTYEELVKILDDNFGSKKNVIASRIALFVGKQREGQSAKQLVSDLHRLAGECGFETMTNPRDEMTMAAAIRGFKDNNLRNMMLQAYSKDWKLSDFQEKVNNYEAAKKASEEIGKLASGNLHEPTSLNSVSNHKTVCKCCGGTHPKEKCPAKEEQCRFCSKIGHFEKRCFSKKRAQEAKTKKANMLEQESDSDFGENPDFSLLMIDRCRHNLHPPLKIQANVNYSTVEFLHDSGADTSVINENVWQRIGKPILVREKRIPKDYNKKPVHILGKCFVNMKISGKRANVWLTVSRGKRANLLGRDLIGHFQIKSDNFFLKIPSAEVDEKIMKLKSCISNKKIQKGNANTFGLGKEKVLSRKLKVGAKKEQSFNAIQPTATDALRVVVKGNKPKKPKKRPPQDFCVR